MKKPKQQFQQFVELLVPGMDMFFSGLLLIATYSVVNLLIYVLYGERLKKLDVKGII